MKLDAIMEKEEKKPGTYVGAKFTPSTVARLKHFAKKHEIPNYLDSDKYHSTIIYSRKHVPDLSIEEKLVEKWIGKPDKLELFETGNGSKALVMLYVCDEQTKLHHHIRSTTCATHDYPEYKVHVTLSYDIEDYDQDKLEELPLHTIGDLEIHLLYTEELSTDWAASTIRKKD
jgi:hypothetical protein